MRPHLARPAILQLVACNIPDRAEPTEEPVAEPPAEDPIAVVNQNTNVRTGPSTDYAVAYRLTAGDEVTVVGRNEDGDWAAGGAPRGRRRTDVDPRSPDRHRRGHHPDTGTGTRAAGRPGSGTA